MTNFSAATAGAGENAAALTSAIGSRFADGKHHLGKPPALN
jgi:hypothetical protein